MFQFLHAADLHLDSPLKGLDEYEGAPAETIRGATRRALEHLVQLAIDEQVAFVLIAGDIYDGDWKDYNTGLFFARQMARLGEAGIAVYLISGNHDAASVISRQLTLPENVHVFSPNRAETFIHEAARTAIHGQSFADRAEPKNLAAKYPRPKPGCFNIGLLHTSVTGFEGHDTYAPCTVDDLTNLNYDYWALGHIHTRQFLSDADPVIAFSGNIQGRHIRETGPKGCLLVRVDSGKPTTEFRPLDVFRWEEFEIDVSACDDAEAALALAAEQAGDRLGQCERPTGVRIRLLGNSPAHRELLAETEHWENELRARLMAGAGTSVWLERLRIATSPPVEQATWDNDGPLAEIHQLLAGLEDDPELIDALAGELAEMKKKIPYRLRQGLFDFDSDDSAAGFDDDRWLRSLAQQAGENLLQRLTRGE